MFHPRYSLVSSSCIFFLAVILTDPFEITASVTDNSTSSFLSTFQPIRSVYYDLSNHQQLETTRNNSIKFPSEYIKYSSRGGPCQHYDLTYECCTGLKIGSIDLNKTCAKLNFLPEDFAIETSLLINGTEVARHTISGKNPGPVCSLPMFIGPLAVQYCIDFYDIHVTKGTFYMCADFETKINQWSIFMLHFNCIKWKFANGTSVTWVDYADIIESNETFIRDDNATQAQVAISQVFDKVDFEPDEAGDDNSTSIVFPEKEDDKIGTHKS